MQVVLQAQRRFFCSTFVSNAFSVGMEKASARKALVKELRTYARQVKVTQARDDSGRAKVEAKYRKIIAKASVEVKRLVEEKFKA